MERRVAKSAIADDADADEIVWLYILFETSDEIADTLTSSLSKGL